MFIDCCSGKLETIRLISLCQIFQLQTTLSVLVETMPNLVNLSSRLGGQVLITPIRLLLFCIDICFVKLDLIRCFMLSYWSIRNHCKYILSQTQEIVFTAAKSFCSGEIYFAAASVLVFDLMANNRFRHY